VRVYVARACACTRVQHGTEYPYQRGTPFQLRFSSDGFARAHAGGWGGVHDRVRERIGDRLSPPPTSVVATTTASTTAGTSTRASRLSLPRATIPLPRTFPTPRYPSPLSFLLSFFSSLFLGRGEGCPCVPHDNFE